MLQQDYILRLLREFMDALARMLEKKEMSSRREEIRRMYDQYVGPYALYHNATMDEVLTALAPLDDEKRMAKLEMLAELYYAEAETVGQPTRGFLLDKAFTLFQLIDRQGKTFSFERRRKMSEIHRRLSQGAFRPS